MSVQRLVWTNSASWQGEFSGASFGSEISIIFTRLDRPGSGPLMHRHPYSETFIIRQGTVIFYAGSAEIEASAGEIIVIPRGVPHRFAAKSGTVEMIDIHGCGQFITEWLEDHAETGPEEAGHKSHAK